MESIEEKGLQEPQQLPLDSSIQNRRKRRSKNDDSGRDFVCECGKSYLSYSALYTHSKVKHGNKITLEQSLYTSVNANRPQKPNFIDLDVLQALEEGRKQYSLAYLLKLIQTVKREANQQYAKLAVAKKAQINNVIFMDNCRKYWENREKDDEVMDSDVYVLSIDKAIGYLLIKCENDFKKDQFLFIQSFVMKMRAELNDMKNNWSYSQNVFASQFAKEMNDLMMTRFKGTNTFRENPTLTAMLIYNICRWMLAERFTTCQLRLNLVEMP